MIPTMMIILPRVLPEVQRPLGESCVARCGLNSLYCRGVCARYVFARTQVSRAGRLVYYPLHSCKFSAGFMPNLESWTPDKVRDFCLVFCTQQIDHAGLVVAAANSGLILASPWIIFPPIARLFYTFLRESAKRRASERGRERLIIFTRLLNATHLRSPNQSESG